LAVRLCERSAKRKGLERKKTTKESEGESDTNHYSYLNCRPPVKAQKQKKWRKTRRPKKQRKNSETERSQKRRKTKREGENGLKTEKVPMMPAKGK